jgi:O-antigen/teichoic acid export membrane protein
MGNRLSDKLQCFAKRTFRGQANRGMMLLISGTALSQALAMIAAPLLTRLYSVQDFGNLRSYISLLTFGAVLAALRYEATIVMVEDDQDATAMAVLSLGIVACTSLTTFFVLKTIVSGALFPDLFPELRKYSWVLPFSMLGAGSYLVLSEWALRQKAFKEVAATKLTQSIGQIATQLSLGAICHAGLPGLLAADALGRAGGSFRLLRNALNWHKGFVSRVELSRVKYLAIRYHSFSLVSSVSTLLNTASSQVPTLLICWCFGSDVLGWYALAESFMNVPGLIVGKAVSQVYVSGAAPLARSQPGALRVMFVQRLRQLALFGIIPFLLVFLFSPWVFAMVFGRNWEEAGHYARILAPMNYVAFVAWPLIPTLNLLERQSWQFGWDLCRLILTVGSLACVHFLGGGGRMCVAVFSITLMMAYSAHACLSYHAVCRQIGIGSRIKHSLPVSSQAIKL